MMSDCVANAMDRCLGRCRFVGVAKRGYCGSME
ncbi:hypothetical protein JMJ77_0011200, partial [Colletotrichum scovillei]